MTFRYLEETALLVLEEIKADSPRGTAMPQHNEPTASLSSYFSKTKRRATDFEQAASPKKRALIIPKMDGKKFKVLRKKIVKCLSKPGDSSIQNGAINEHLAK